jgi:hypothetical protein
MTKKEALDKIDAQLFLHYTGWHALLQDTFASLNRETAFYLVERRANANDDVKGLQRVKIRLQDISTIARLMTDAIDATERRLAEIDAADESKITTDRNE